MPVGGKLMDTIKSCPKCNKILEPVTTYDGKLLGYFCKGVIFKTCDYINCVSTSELRSSKYDQDKTTTG